MKTFYQCDGVASVSTVDPAALQCSTGWVEVTEPTFNLITYEQASALLTGLFVLFTVIAVFRELGRGWR